MIYNNQIVIEWMKIKETTLNECDILPKILNLNHKLKVIDKIHLVLVDLILVNDVYITDLNYFYYDSMWWNVSTSWEN